MAAPRPTHSTIAGVPASNFHGRLLNDVFSSSTDWIISPPLMNGGILASSSSRPQSAPAPLGPGSLWPENAKKSQPSSCTSTARCGADWAPSTTTTASRSCAQSQISRTGLSVPSEFDWCTTATSLTRPACSIAASWSRSRRPSSVTPM